MDLNVNYVDLILDKEKRIFGRNSSVDNDAASLNEYYDKLFQYQSNYQDNFTEKKNIASIYYSISKHLENYIRQFRQTYQQKPSWEISALVQLILFHKPDLIGFSYQIFPQYYYLIALGRALKAETEIPIIVGGPLSGSLEQDQNVEGLFDKIIDGEGELPLSRFILSQNGIDQKKNSTLLNSIQEQNGLIHNLNQLPFPDYSDLHLQNYFNLHPTLWIMGSRGCAWEKCSFCVLYKGTSNFRIRESSDIVDEMEFLNHHYQITHFDFTDSWISPGRLRSMCHQIIRRGLNIRFSFFGRPIPAYNEELLNLAAKAGVDSIRWGCESGSQRILDLMSKGTTVVNVEGVLQRSHKVGIKNNVTFIVGFPGEMESDYQETVSFTHKIQPYVNSFRGRFFNLYKGSKVYDEPAKFGIKICEDDPSIHSTANKSVGFQRVSSAGKRNNNADEQVVQRYKHFRTLLNQYNQNRIYDL